MKALTRDELRAITPAAFADNHNMSDKYRQVSTESVLDLLGESGFVPIGSKQDNPTRRPISQVTHSVVLRHVDYLKLDSSDLNIPQITFVNSHNGRTKARLYGGLFRLICLNGLVAGNPAYMHTVRHTGEAPAAVLKYADDMREGMARLSEAADRWESVELSVQQAERLATSGALLRFGEERAKRYSVDDILGTRRSGDEGRSLWRVFNRIQENCLRAGLPHRREDGREFRSRELTGVLPSLEFNTALWRAAEAFA